MEHLFGDIAREFSGKTFTKDDLIKRFYPNEESITDFYDKMTLQHKKDMENYIKTSQKKAQNQTL